MADSKCMTLGYWNIRGLGQSIRLMLKYTGTEFNNVQYDERNGGSWFDDKEKLGLDFPNLPYLIDGDVKITQSFAILRYIGRKHNLSAKSEKEMAYLGMLEHVAMDFRNGFVMFVYNKKDFEEKRDGYVKTAKESVQRFSDYLGDKQWFNGSEMTYVDFFLYEILDHHRLFEKGFLDHVPNIQALMERFEARPAIKAYMESDEFMKEPINASFSGWPGGKHQ
ncbi:glutathione S-transferase Mu 2-like [Halichondria panicea]|uniref:glutathione S-transferase Mu 2-like n=1 Tax=Halichondria panicea TaxID=6063 RepID=UPI00312B88CC